MKPSVQKPKSRVSKLIAVVNLLRDRNAPVTAAKLGQAIGVSERTVYRYISELVAQGMPIQGEAGFGYVLRPGLFLPPMALTEDEAEAVLFGLRLAEGCTNGAFASSIRLTLVKIQDVLSTAAKDVFRLPAIAIEDGEDPKEPRVDFEPYLRAIRSHSRMSIEAAGSAGKFKGVVCPVTLRVSSPETELLAWHEKEAAFMTVALQDVLIAEVMDSRCPHSRERLLRVWESGQRLG